MAFRQAVLMIPGQLGVAVKCSTVILISVNNVLRSKRIQDTEFLVAFSFSIHLIFKHILTDQKKPKVI